MTCVEPYFKSEWNIIKGNAAMFVGYLLGNIPLDNRKIYNLNPTRVTKGTNLPLPTHSYTLFNSPHILLALCIPDGCLSYLSFFLASLFRIN
jgi:hypothetical protein